MIIKTVELIRSFNVILYFIFNMIEVKSFNFEGDKLYKKSTFIITNIVEESRYNFLK